MTENNKQICGRCNKPKDGKGEVCNCGRPWFNGKDEAAVVAKLEEAWGMDCPDTEAALYADISIDSLKRYYEEHEELRTRRDLLRSKPMLRVRTTIINSLDDPDYAFRYAERKAPKEFGTKTQLSDTLLGPLTIQIIRADGSTTTTDNKTP